MQHYLYRPMSKRHFKGANKSEEKEKRRKFAENWKNTRSDGKSSEGNDTSTIGVKQNNRGDGWSTSSPENPRFEAFYKCQGFIFEGNDWENFIKYLRLPLPACFRICPDYSFASALRSQLLALSSASKSADGNFEGVEELKWVPNGSAYKLGTDRRSIRKLDSLKQLHAWCKLFTFWYYSLFLLSQRSPSG